ncbi:hypothetical protein QEZ54_06845 [Catellatospora sp. KI3]|uniref:hypothetical protein n=1 Tax=Catellatospora sp. KI3 TaxID=3041620 RepID=UPI0024828A40|nr:hypothetical protein [Catellatospora sp. KI3]MDI1460676.1 hypothetical protein [Catellatospora sp. KI3]
MPRPRLIATETGHATATNGGFANSGIVNGDLYMVAPAPTYSPYREQHVARIAPDSLLDRDDELAELARFCTSDTGSYSYWQAPAWAGKSALLSWFVLHPPAGVRIVSFFITARFRGHQDRVAFVDVLLPQLAEMLGEPRPTVTEATAEMELLHLLHRTAARCTARGERLVLVVDGLDEDRGVTLGPDAYSVAAMLPWPLPNGLKVIVAGRPNPPVPDDVPEGHPLRDGRIVRPLSGSAQAGVVRMDMIREIQRLLDGPSADQELLSLLTAAGGGLSDRDLAELTDRPLRQVQRQLRTIAGRSFARRTTRWTGASPTDVYVLGHEELQTEAIDSLGAARLAESRLQLHGWADGYRLRRWPVDTPEYLLRGYFDVLRDTEDLARMVVCGTDPARHHRMLRLSGGHGAALREIIIGQDRLLAQPEPDLDAIARLTVHRHRLAKRADGTRVNLPAVWARLGQPDRAEEMAYSIPDPERRAWALALVVRALTEQGDLPRAEAVANRIGAPRWQAYAWSSLAVAYATSGDRVAAADRWRAADEASSALHHDSRAWALAGLIEAAASVEDTTRASALLTTLIGIVDPANLDADNDGSILAVTAASMAHAGTIAAASGLAKSIVRPRWRTYALIGIANALLVQRDVSQALEFAQLAQENARSADPGTSFIALAPLVAVLSRAGDHAAASELADEVEAGARSTPTARYRAYIYAELSKSLLVTGDASRAWELAERCDREIASDAAMYDETAVMIAPLAVAGDVDRAESLTHTLAVDWWQVCGLTTTAIAAAASGDVARADQLRRQAEVVAGSIAAPGILARCMSLIIDVRAALGDFDGARELAERAVADARSMPEPDGQVAALTDVIHALTTAGEATLARELAAEAEAQARTIPDAFPRSGRLADLVTSVAHGSDGLAHELAERVLATVLQEDKVDVIALAATFDRIAASGRDDIDMSAMPADARTIARRVGWPAAVAMLGDFDMHSPDLAQSGPLRAMELATLAAGAVRAGLRTQAQELARCAVEAAAEEHEFWQDQVFASLAEAMYENGDAERAERFASAISNPHHAAWAVAGVTEGATARRAVANALRIGGWTTPDHRMFPSPSRFPLEMQLSGRTAPPAVLLRVQPPVLSAIADELILLNRYESQSISEE